MSDAGSLDDFLSQFSDKVHKSDRKLAKIVRDAYPIGVPALIMKSGTDRIGESAGYSFYLGTPDDLLRSLASWLLSFAGERQSTLLRLIKRLWKRHGREDIALSSLLLANLDHKNLNINPWEFLTTILNKTEPLDAILLIVEELFRAKKDIPSNEIFEKWCNGKRIEGHLAIICAYNMMKSNYKISDDIISKLSSIPVYRRDSILSRVKDEVTLKKNKQDGV